MIYVIKKRALSPESRDSALSSLRMKAEGETIFLYSSPVIYNADCVFYVNGDSMEPEYHDGDMVLVERFPNCPELQFGEIGAFICGNNSLIILM